MQINAPEVDLKGLGLEGLGVADRLGLDTGDEDEVGPTS